MGITIELVKEAAALPKLSVQSCRRLCRERFGDDVCGLALCSLAWQYRETGTCNLEVGS